MYENDSCGPADQELAFYPCPCCRGGRMFIKNSQIALIKWNDLDTPRFECLRCDKSFNNIDVLSDHESCLSSGDETQEVDEIPMTYLCKMCEIAFDDKDAFCTHECYRKLRRKKKTLTKDETVCQICDKSFSTSLSLRRHIHTCHSMVNFMCQICEKKFPKKYLLKVHYRSHTGEKPYPCETCGRRFTSSVLLWSHQKFSHAEKGYQCDECSEFFATRQILGNHIRVKHTKERSLHCEICGKKFLNTSVFYQHKATHSDVRKHGCQVCNMRFKRRSTLQKHELIHTDTRPHLCLICGKGFRQLGDLKKHSYALHSGQSDSI